MCVVRERSRALPVARSDAGKMNKRTSQIVFLGVRVDEARSAALAASRSAGAALLRSRCCRRWRRAAASIVSGLLAGGEACRRSNSGAALCAIAPRGRWRVRGAGMSTGLLFPVGRRAGPPCIGNKEYGGSVQTRIGFCRSVCFICRMSGSVCLMRHLICSAESCVSIRGSTGDFRISSRSS